MPRQHLPLASALARCYLEQFVTDHLDAPFGADMTLGQKIRRLREELRMTQKQLAEGECSDGYISAIERDQVKTPSLDLLRRLAKRLGVPVAELQHEPAPGSFGTYAEQSARLEYEQIHAKMLAAGRDAARGRAELERLKQQMGDRAPRSLAWFAAYAACRQGDTDVALREAVAYLEEAEAARDDQARAEAHWLLGLIHATQHETVRAVAEYHRVLEMEDRAYFDLDAAMTIRGEFSRLLLLQGDVSGSITLDQEALGEYENFADPASRVRRAYALAEETASTGNWLKAYRFIRWAWLSQREEAARHVAAQSNLRIALARSHGDGRLPVEELRQSLALADQASDAETRLLATALLALTLAEQNETAEARQIIAADPPAEAGRAHSGAPAADEMARQTAAGALVLARGWLTRAEGDNAGALSLAQQAEDILRGVRGELRLSAAAAVASLSRLYEAMGETTAALSALRMTMSMQAPGGHGTRGT